ncbi:hypothetical protein MTO96_014369 [Rhipicephalus appendiculatus]
MFHVIAGRADPRTQNPLVETGRRQPSATTDGDMLRGETQKQTPLHTLGVAVAAAGVRECQRSVRFAIRAIARKGETVSVLGIELLKLFLPYRSRWLVLMEGEGGESARSLLRPPERDQSRAACRLAPPTVALATRLVSFSAAIARSSPSPASPLSLRGADEDLSAGEECAGDTRTLKGEPFKMASAAVVAADSPLERGGGGALLALSRTSDSV